MKKLASLFTINIPTRILYYLLPLIILQLLLPIRCIALFLIEKIGIPFIVLALFETLTVPVSLLILCIFIIQRLNWSWLKQKPFILGYVFFTLGHGLNLLLYLSGSKFLFRAFDFYSTIILGFLVPIVKPIFYIYGGWDFAASVTLLVFFQIFVVVPFLAGIIFSLAGFTYKRVSKFIIRAVTRQNT